MLRRTSLNIALEIVLSLVVLLPACSAPATPTVVTPAATAAVPVEASQPPAATRSPADTPLPPTATFTSAPPTSTPAPTATPTALPSPTPTLAPKPVVLEDWKWDYFKLMPYGCKDGAPKCWEGVGMVYTITSSKQVGKTVRHAQSNKSYLLTKTPLRIDAAWPSPALVFWHKFKLTQSIFFRVQTGGVWKEVREIIDHDAPEWTRTSLDLTPYKGQEISIEISSVGSIWWWVQELQIVPDFIAPTPAPVTPQATDSSKRSPCVMGCYNGRCSCK